MSKIRLATRNDKDIIGLFTDTTRRVIHNIKIYKIYKIKIFK